MMKDGVHFVVYAPDATEVNLLLFAQPDAQTPAHIIPMEKRGDDWKIKIQGEGIGARLLYMYQAKGLNKVSKDDQYDLMFNENYYLNDPYAYKTQNVKYSHFFSAVPHTDTTAPVYAGGSKSKEIIYLPKGGNFFVITGYYLFPFRSLIG